MTTNDRPASSTPHCDVSQTNTSQRIASIDVLRGLTILVMLFVNDVAGVPDIPAWLKHIQPSDADGMTFVDIVFPAFLFIVGMSIPLAIGRRLEKGASWWQVERTILLRVFGLLVIGFFMVNADGISKESVLPKSVWILLSYLGILLVWNSWSTTPAFFQRFAWGFRTGGIVLLCVLAIVYRTDNGSGFIEMRPQWWGILGLIGWAYLVAAHVYLLTRNSMMGLLGAMCLLYCVFMADWNGHFPEWWIFRWVDIASALGSLPAIVVAGVILGVLLRHDSPIQQPASRIRWALVYGIGLALGGHLLHALHDMHPMFHINKINATPPWGLWCSAITVWLWVVIYWIVDVLGFKRWTIVVQPAGKNPLLAYILAPVLYASFDLWTLVTGWSSGYFEWITPRSIGCLRSVIHALALTWIAGILRRLGVSLRL